LQLDDGAIAVRDHVLTADYPSVAQAHFAAGRQTVEIGRRIHHEIVAIDVQHTGEIERACSLPGHVVRPAGCVE
jgi:hypothetical protein